MEPDASPATTCCASSVTTNPTSGLSVVPKAPRTSGGGSGEPGGSPDAHGCRWSQRRHSVPQVCLANRLVLRELAARPLERDAADLKHVGPARGAQRELRVLLDDEHGEALLLVQLADDAEELAHDHRGKTQGGLVEEEQPGAGHERPGERQHLLLAAGERPCLLVTPVFKPREVTADALVAGGEAVSPQVGPKPQVVVDGELAEDPVSLGNVRDAEPGDALRRAAADALTAEADLARLRHEDRERPQRRRLPGSVPAEDGDDFSFRDLQRHAVEHLHRPVAGVDAVELEHGGHYSVVPRYASITAGSRCTSAGVPAAIFCPKSSTVTESETRMTRPM